MVDSLKLKQFFLKEKSQFLVLLGLCLAVWALSVIIYLFNAPLFLRFLGTINPLAAFPIVIFLGAVALTFLVWRSWFSIYKQQNFKGVLRASALAAFFGMLIILFDLKVSFPADTNVPLPHAFWFYPTIGFLAEMVFHVIPISIFCFLASRIFRKMSVKHLLWFSIMAVSLLEPWYQTWPLSSSTDFPLWAIIYVGVHIFFISLCQLWLFKQYDFITMYAFRFTYYLIWHVGWGYLRLQLLF